MFWRGVLTNKTNFTEDATMVPWVDLAKCSMSMFDQTSSGKNRKRLRRHIPHAERPSEFVRKRNQRERRRVETVNKAFEDLRDRVPFMKEDDKTSKVSILKYASRYIHLLSTLLLENEQSQNAMCSRIYSESKQNSSPEQHETECCMNIAVTEEQMGNEHSHKMGIESSCRFKQQQQQFGQSAVMELNGELYWRHFQDEATSHIAASQTLF